MIFDKNNKIVQLCAEGMNFEGQGNNHKASQLFMQAWVESTNDVEKFISAHYVARQQKSVEEKLSWDKITLEYALKIEGEEIKGSLPSLYLNIGKGYEDTQNLVEAKRNYSLGLDYVEYLPDDGYGNMIKTGINNGINRISSNYHK